MAKEMGITIRIENLYDGISDLHQIPFTFAKTRENKSSTDWAGFLNGLKQIGFQGTLSFETAPVLTAFPEVMKQDALVFIARVGEYFAGEICGEKQNRQTNFDK